MVPDLAGRGEKESTWCMVRRCSSAQTGCRKLCWLVFGFPPLAVLAPTIPPLPLSSAKETASAAVCAPLPPSALLLCH